MATWEDGPEYAPAERPAQFANPHAVALEEVPPVVDLAAEAPKHRPVFADPPAPVASLHSLVPVAEDQRDPNVPFDVAGSTVTSMDSAWASAHWSPQNAPVPGTPGPYPAPYPDPAGAPPEGYPATPPHQFPPPSGSPQPPWAPPGAPIAVHNGAASSPTGFPQPGTPNWFAPAPSQTPASPPVVSAKSLIAAATPGLLITLALGGLLFFLAPVTLAVATLLATRVRVAKDRVRRTFLIAWLVWSVLALVSCSRYSYSFAEWWSSVGANALLVSWVVLVAVLVHVHRGLKNTYDPPTPRHPSTWG